MPFDGGGNFTRTPGTLIANSAALVSQQVNDETNNAVTGINGKVNLDGKLAMTGLQTLSGDGTAVAHPATVKQLQQEIISKAASVAGTVDAITIAMSPASVAWVTKETFEWISGGANTSATPTINKDGIGAKTIVSSTGAALAAGATGVSGVLNRGYYDGTNVRLLTPQASAFTGGTATSALIMSGKDFREAKGANVAAAATTDIWTNADGNDVNVTGNTGITSFGTAHQAGEKRYVLFTGTPLITYNGTSMVMNTGGSNYQVAAGDFAIVDALTTANMQVTIFPASGGAISVGKSLSNVTTSGTTVDITVTGTPTRIFVALNGVSGSAAGNLTLRLGTGGGIVSTNYASMAVGSASTNITTSTPATTSFQLSSTAAASSLHSGVLTLIHTGGNNWSISGGIADPVGNIIYSTAGTVSLGAAVTTIRLLMGAGTFDAGSISAAWD